MFSQLGKDEMRFTSATVTTSPLPIQLGLAELVEHEALLREQTWRVNEKAEVEDVFLGGFDLLRLWSSHFLSVLFFRVREVLCMRRSRCWWGRLMRDLHADGS
jgi:hypothetical protein